MAEFALINRRLFLRRLGKGTIAVAVLSSCERNVTLASSIAEEPVVGSTTSPTTTSAAGTTATPPTSDEARFHRIGSRTTSRRRCPAPASIRLGWSPRGGSCQPASCGSGINYWRPTGQQPWSSERHPRTRRTAARSRPTTSKSRRITRIASAAPASGCTTKVA